MGVRDRIAAAVKAAEPEADAARLSTLRLIQAAIRDRDIATRNEGTDAPVSDEELRAILERMAAQRRESARAYEEAVRLEQAQAKLAEVAVIEEFLPRPMSDQETDTAIDAVLAEFGERSIRDMGRVMARLKERYSGRMDFAEAGRRVKDRLG